MKILRADISGFRSFTGDTSVDLSHEGLILIRGKNDVEPTLGANGTGKSTLWDAVTWAAFGKTARGLSGPSVQSWQGRESVSVALTLLVNGVERTITRTRAPNRLMLDGEEVRQGVVDDMLGLTYDQWLHVVLMSQFSTLLPDLKPQQRLELLDDVLDLEKWVVAQQRARDAVKDAKERAYNAEMKMVRDDARREALAYELEQARIAAANRASEHAEHLNRINAELDAARVDLELALERKASAYAHLDTVLDAKQALERKEAKLSERYMQLREAATRANAELVIAEAEETAAKARLERLKSVGEGVCPTCEQRVVGSAAMINEALAGFKEAQAKADSLHRAYQAACEARDTARAAVRDLASSRQDGELQEAQRAVQAADRDVGSARSDIHHLEAQAAHHEGVTHDVPSGMEERLAEAEALCSESRVAWYLATDELTLIDYWPQGFKELRLWVIQNALDELAVYTNASLVELGLPDWEVTFTTSRAGASKGSLEVLVKSPYSPERVPWESWSGGETQRLRVACAVGIGDLVRARMADAPECEVWDEPTAHLDDDGVADLVSYFAARATERQVWLVDHRSIDSGHFDTSILVRKTSEGSLVEVC